MASYLDTHPPASKQFRSRREEPSGVIVVHTAENTPDHVAFDGGAEAVARFIATRSDPGSYHDLVDSDSTINLVGYENEAFHDATGSNRHSYGVSVATRGDVWPLAPAVWRAGAVAQAAAAAARYARWLHDRRGITVPAQRISRPQSELRVPGFISHAERDPARRSDPGKAFPWVEFLAEFSRLRGLPTTSPAITTEDDGMFTFIDANGTGWLVTGGTRLGLKSLPDLQAVQREYSAAHPGHKLPHFAVSKDTAAAWVQALDARADD